MSDNIPFHIQEEILERLPVKSLIKFQSVSKAWRSLINSSDFVAAHSRRRHTQPEHLLVQYHDQLRHKMKTYTFLVDDDTSPQQRFFQTLPLSIKYSLSPRLIGSSHGLLCVTIGDFKIDIWNPSIRKSIRIPLPPATSSFTFLSFGVCPITLDPKIFNMRQCVDWGNTENDYTHQCKAMVYTLSSGKWRQISSNNLPTKAVMYPKVPHVIIDRFIYWLAYYPPTAIHMIMSFDMTNESFEVIDLPPT